MTYYTKIFGCQMNYSDAERIATILEKNKFRPAASIEAADLIVFVTCGVRQSAEDRAYGQINNLRKKYPAKYIVLTGCLAHRKDVQRRLMNKVDLFTTIIDFPKNISKFIHNSHFIIPDSLCHENYNNYLKIKPRYTSKHTAYIPIMTGCNNFCAFCVVPYARGREYSRPAVNILKEVRDLINKGYKEIILLGQNVNSYRSKFEIKNSNLKLRTLNFAKFLRLIDCIPGKFWITFLTSHPKDMSDELIETIAKSLSASGGKKICEYVSLPAQSGDNEILRKMNRHYTIEHYKKLVKKIRAAFIEVGPQSVSASGPTSIISKFPPAISTDIIVGFSGETRKQFENTAKLMRELKFDMVYISQYSPRPETAALRLKDNVSKKEKVRREKILTKILEKTALENNKKYVGKIVEVLIDRALPAKASRTSRAAARDGRMLAGHARSQKKVVFRSNKKIPVGSFQKVKVTKARAFGLEGNLTQDT